VPLGLIVRYTDFALPAMIVPKKLLNYMTKYSIDQLI